MLSLLRVGTLAAACCQADPAWSQTLGNEPLAPLPQAAPADPARLALGRRLFADPRLSHDNRQSCASCHDLAQGGADGRARSPGYQGKPTLFNTPTVYNSIHNFRHSWNGQTGTLAERLDAIVASPALMASSWSEIVAKLGADDALARQFRAAYGRSVQQADVSDALVRYLGSLVTPSRFDRFLRGEADAISADEKQGYLRFKSFGCAACHQGVNVGGNMFQKFGVMRELPGPKDSPADLGRYAVTGREADRHVFRVPSLRNVALTAPYFHDGSAATLEDAVDVMFRYQLGRNASAQDKAAIVRFLHALNGEGLPRAGAGK